jgi:sec-independent protein translocase protein TatC
MPLAAHFRELRDRLVRSALAVLLGGVLVWTKYPFFFSVIRRPYDIAHTKHPDAILALTGVTTGFSLQMKVSVAVGVVIASPIWLYQLWRFISPGLHRNERTLALGFSAIATPLFLAGAALAYRVLPQMLDVLFGFTPSDVTNVTSMDLYITFFIQLLLFFGIGFLIPLVLIGLNAVGVLSGARLKDSWRYIVLGSFVFGAVATPSGDPVGMTIVAVPMIALSLIAVAIALANDKRRDRTRATSGTDQWSDDEVSPL